MIVQQQPPKRPQCQCVARRDALQRAKEADERGDKEAADKERAFVKQSMIEDAKAHAAWLAEMRDHYMNKFRRGA